MEYYHCVLCQTPIVEDKKNEHVSWHNNVINDFTFYTISVYWANQIEKEIANNLRNNLRSKNLNVSKVKDIEPGHTLPRFDVIVKHDILDATKKTINSARSSCLVKVFLNNTDGSVGQELYTL